MPEEAEILETVDKLPIYDAFGGEKPSPKQIWEGTEGDLHFWATKSHVASHSGGFYLELRVEGKSEEEKKQFIANFISALGEPFRESRDLRWPDDDSFGWSDVGSIIERKKRENIEK